MTKDMFRVTSIRTSATDDKDPTKWMGGGVYAATDGPPTGTNQPPPWDWQTDPGREHYQPTQIATMPPQRLPDAAGGGYRTVTLEYDADTRQRFTHTHELMAFALAELEPGIELELPPGTKAGGQLRDAMAAADDNSKPFASPYYWAGFVITGDGGVQCRLRRL